MRRRDLPRAGMSAALRPVGGGGQGGENGGDEHQGKGSASGAQLNIKPSLRAAKHD
jgi:hypothetical protein